MQTGPKGFFGSLYDFRFASFVTPKLASIFYGIIVVLTTIAGFVSIIVFLTQLGGNDAGEAVLGIISVLIMTPLFHILTRVALESSVAYIRTAENTAVLVEQGNWNYRNQTQQGGPTQY